MADQPVMYMCSKCSQLYSDLEEFKTHECVTGDEVYLPEGEGEGVDASLVDQQQYDEGQQYQADMGELEAQPPEELMGQIEDQQMQEAAELPPEQDTTGYAEQPAEGMEQEQTFWNDEMVSLLLEATKKNLSEGKFGSKLWQSVSEEVIQAASVPADQANPTGVKEKWMELMREYMQNRSSNQAHLSPFAAEMEYFYDNHRQIYIDIEKGQTGRSPFWTQAKTLDLVRIMSREKSKFGNDLRGRNALYAQVAGILTKQYGAPITPQQIKGKYNRLCQSYQKTTGNRVETEDSSFFDNLLSFIVEEGGMEEEHEEEEHAEDGKLTEPEPSGDEEYKPKKPVKTITKPLTRPAVQTPSQKKPVKAKWSLELAKVLITIVKEHHKLLETGATSEAQFFEHCSKWLKERAGAEIDGPTLQTKYNRMRSEFDTYLMRQGEKPKEMPMSTYLSRMEAKLKEHVETPRSKVASAPSTPAAPPAATPTASTSEEGAGFQWDDKSTRMFLRILRHFTKAVEANEITIDQVCKDAADILQSYVKLNVTGDQCRRRWQILTAKHRDMAKGGVAKPSFAKSLSILEKTFGIEKMEEGEKTSAVTDELKEEESATSDLLKNRPGITLSKVAPPKETPGSASTSGCANCGKFDKVLSTLLKDEREMRKKEHESLLKVIKDQTDAMNSFKAAIAALTKVCQHISTAQDNISKQLPKLAGGAGKRIRDDDTPENRSARRRRTGD